MRGAYIVSALRVLLTAGILFGFPALAIVSWKRGGIRRLATATAVAAAVVLAFSLIGASSAFGNVRAATSGYVNTAVGSVLLFGISFGFPIATTVATVLLLGRDKLPFWAVYAATIGAAACGWILGTVVSLWIVPMFA